MDRNLLEAQLAYGAAITRKLYGGAPPFYLHWLEEVAEYLSPGNVFR